MIKNFRSRWIRLISFPSWIFVWKRLTWKQSSHPRRSGSRSTTRCWRLWCQVCSIRGMEGLKATTRILCGTSSFIRIRNCRKRFSWFQFWFANFSFQRNNSVQRFVGIFFGKRCSRDWETSAVDLTWFWLQHSVLVRDNRPTESCFAKSL